MKTLIKSIWLIAQISLCSVIIADKASVTTIDLAMNLFTEAASSESVPGISLAVADQSGLVWAQGFGYADIEKKIPMTRETKLRIGSVAKVFTATALMRLLEQGKIDLNADVRETVKEWPKKHKKITLKQLTNHTSGIRHYKGNEFLSTVEYPDSVTSLNIFKNDNLLYDPGTDHSYSTYGWTLVSAVMEKTMGQSFGQIMSEQVFVPLKMTNTVLDQASVNISNRQTSYTFSNNKLNVSTYVNNSNKYAGGGILSSPSDVVTFAMAHTNPGYLKAGTLEMMLTKQVKESESNFGIGWQVGFDNYLKRYKQYEEKYKQYIDIMRQHPRVVIHSGGSVGGTTMLILCLDHEHAVTVVKNVDGDKTANTLLLALETLDIFYKPH
ncbi:MAG: serine beta-lactamase-like protein LACTB [Enterobacterales bacterium]|jgi:serine beta-lactamase-like protein LACTB